MGQALEIAGNHAAVDAPRRGSNQSGMRAHNERLVLTLIRQAGAMAKAEIARRTGLSAQTVSVIIRALEADGLLQRGEPVRGKIGQPSIPMSLAPEGAFFFGLKVGRRSLDLVLTDFLGEVQHRERLHHPYPTPDGVVAFAREAIAAILEQLKPEHRDRIAGLGIALPFQLWDWAETLGTGATEMEGWKTRDIATEIAGAWDFPVYLCNDASAACGAELMFGNQNRPRDFLYLFVGFFIGGGLVLDETVYTGRTGNAAALGSMLVPAADGEMRQLVDIASLSRLEHALGTKGEGASMIWDEPSGWDVTGTALESWLDEAAHGIARAIMSAVCLIDIQHVLIEGWMPKAMREDLVDRVRRKIEAHPVPGVQTPQVAAGSIGSDARALGAASLPLSQRFGVEHNAFQKGPSR